MAVYIVVPVAHAELLVEAGAVAAHVRDPPPVLVTQMEDLNLVTIIIITETLNIGDRRRRKKIINLAKV